jgi:hypothetical protein
MLGPSGPAHTADMITPQRPAHPARLAAAAVVAIVAGLAVPEAAHADIRGDTWGVQLVNDGSRKCLDVRSEDGSYTSGARVQQYKCKLPDGNQAWYLENLGTGRYNIENVQSGQCLDVTDGSTADGAPTQQSYCNGAESQEWKIVKDGDFDRLVSANSGKCLDVRDGSHADHAIVQQWPCNGSPAQRWYEFLILGNETE